MSTNTPNSDAHYDELVARQIEQYKETEIMHDLPAIYDYWAATHISPKITSVLGYNNLIEFYTDYFQRSLHESDSVFLASIGSGDCAIEIAVVKSLIAKGEKSFFFICLELSPILISKARARIDKEELGDIITVALIDINKWQPKYSFAGIMAHHALHHFLNLEQLFDLIKKKLAANGRFITCDIIGRNGHMRWPEALALTRKIWERLPRKYKFHHQFQRYDDYYENWDCSNEGFEGIRAQDILPLLVKTFSFEVFFTFGNLIDPFIDRCYGPNYDPKAPSDTAFIDYIQELNEQLIAGGMMKPTSIIAVMVNHHIPSPRIYRDWTPAFAVRDPESPAPQYDPVPLLEKMPLRAGKEDHPLDISEAGLYSENKKLVFSSGKTRSDKNTIPGHKYLTYGWGNPEPDFIWSVCEAASIVFPMDRPVTSGLMLILELFPYRSQLSHKNTEVGIAVNDIRIKTLQYGTDEDGPSSPIRIPIPPELLRDRTKIELTFWLPNRRQPQFEPGGDVRSLGIALVSATLSTG